MDKNEIITEIQRLKKEEDAVLLVHNYQIGDIQRIADFLGDSLDLSRKAAEVKASTIVFCGVDFMAETAKILSPEKRVLLPRREATCPMAAMAVPEALKKMKAQHPKAKVVTYVNSSAEVKAESDVCCTSANAVKIVSQMDSDEIIFTPDKNLGAYVQRFTDKTIYLWDGYCYVHNQFEAEEIIEARKAHPDALLMVHPECSPPVIDLADEVLSTSGMVRVAAETKAKTILVGTEAGMIERLQYENPDKRFLSAGTVKTCSGMKAIGLEDVYIALRDGIIETKLPESIMAPARLALERMLSYA
ncbi:quinolinate synthase NadA [bacterium]|nr:quinolinate synthase NadA [bacterium]